MPRRVWLPDRTYVTVEDHVSNSEALAWASQEYPDAFPAPSPPPKEPVPGFLSGMGQSVAKGAESMGSSLRTGIGSLFGDPTEAAQAGIARKKDIEERYKSIAPLSDLSKVKEP